MVFPQKLQRAPPRDETPWRPDIAADDALASPDVSRARQFTDLSTTRLPIGGVRVKSAKRSISASLGGWQLPIRLGFHPYAFFKPAENSQALKEANTGSITGTPSDVWSS